MANKDEDTRLIIDRWVTITFHAYVVVYIDGTDKDLTLDTQ